MLYEENLFPLLTAPPTGLTSNLRSARKSENSRRRLCGWNGSKMFGYSVMSRSDGLTSSPRWVQWNTVRFNTTGSYLFPRILRNHPFATCAGFVLLEVGR